MVQVVIYSHAVSGLTYANQKSRDSNGQHKSLRRRAYNLPAEANAVALDMATIVYVIKSKDMNALCIALALPCWSRSLV
jgi:hypothetical protein